MPKSKPPVILEEYVARIVDAAPPLTPRQRDLIAATFSQSRREVERAERIADHAARVVAEWPKLTPDQLARVGVLLSASESVTDAGDDGFGTLSEVVGNE